MKVSFCDIDGVRTRYYHAGSGPALVLVQPVGYPVDCFVRNIETLGKKYTVIAPDVLGQGFTDAPPVWDRPPQVMMADHLGRLLDHLGIARFSVAGSSLGALIATLLCLRRPEASENLIIIGSGTVFNEPSAQPTVLQTVLKNGSVALSDPSAENCRRRMRGTCHLEVEAEDIVLTQMTAYALPHAFENYKAIMSGLIDSIVDPAATVYPHLGAIRNRTLVIVGEQDPRTSLEAHWEGAKRMPDARLVRVPDCGHLPFLEYPQLFNDIVTRFLDGEEVGERPRTVSA
jgi:pimeloyl-ACP methyl ester carboxylesterase